MKPERLDRKTIYTSEWVNLYRDRVRLPSGTVLPEYHVIDFPKECAAAVIENDAGNLLFVRIFRYPVSRFSWEIPAGRIDEGESVIEAARREALEETGYETSDHRRMYAYFPTCGISNQVFHIVGCRAGEKVAAFDEDEVNECRWVSKEDAQRMVRDGSIRDGYTLTALLLHFSEGAQRAVNAASR